MRCPLVIKEEAQHPCGFDRDRGHGRKDPEQGSLSGIHLETGTELAPLVVDCVFIPDLFPNQEAELKMLFLKLTCPQSGRETLRTLRCHRKKNKKL